MDNVLDRTTCLIMGSALLLALACILPPMKDMLLFVIIGRIGFFADTLFHEMGHTVFSWLFGRPAIPMIFTAIGADQAGGMSLLWGFSWAVQIMALIMLACVCYWLKDNVPGLYLPAVAFSVIITISAFTPYPDIIIAYMGHGGSMLCGAFFLFRAWIYLDARNEFTRWLNAFFGFYLTLGNLEFCYSLAFNAGARADYSDHVAFGAAHNDFYTIAEIVPSWNVNGVAMFGIAWGIAAIVGSFVMALLLRDEFIEGGDGEEI